MRTILLAAAALLAAPALAQQAEPAAAPSPGEIVAQAAPSEWVAIAPEDLLVMTLAPDHDGQPPQVVIQLMPPPFSRSWIENIRTLAKAHWWDGLAITRVQDNYVVQWGDPNGEDAAKARPLPKGLRETNEAAYTVDWDADRALMTRLADEVHQLAKERFSGENREGSMRGDPYAAATLAWQGWPIAVESGSVWPVHCYGMVGVGRGLSPDAGTGAELYTVIGHAPRHLDRNIALVGRVVEGIEHLSSLPRGTGPLGFYEDPAKRVPIQSIRLGSELPAAELPRLEYLSTDGETFARYADARANRRDPFFIVPAGGADICNIPVPVRRAAE